MSDLPRRAVPAATLLLVLVPATAMAAGTEVTVKLDAGAEIDSNIHRAPEGGGVQSSPDARAGLSLAIAGAMGERARYGFSAIGAGKVFFRNDGPSENLGVVSLAGHLDLLADALVPGLVASYYDAFGAPDSFLTLRTGDAAGGLALRLAPGLAITARAGWRFFDYKYNDDFDFDGPRAGVTLADQISADDSSWRVSLVAAYTASVRRYRGRAVVSYCRPGEPLDPMACFDISSANRNDFFHDLALDATYTGNFIVGARVGLQVDNSNSFGQSLVRGRLELTGTAELFADLVFTAKLILQIDSYPDGLLYQADVGSFTTVEDESRNAIILQLTRDITDSWTLETRFAAYGSAFSNQAIAYSRNLFYAGLIYTYR